MAAAATYRDRVRQIALGAYGYVTTRQAAEVGVPAVELRKLAARGALVNVAYGLYRVPDAPASVLDQFAEALLRAGEGSYLRGDSVLALFGLADANPRKIRVVAPRRTRAKMPAFMDVTSPPAGDPKPQCLRGIVGHAGGGRDPRLSWSDRTEPVARRSP